MQRQRGEGRHVYVALSYDFIATCTHVSTEVQVQYQAKLDYEMKNFM